MGRVIGKLLTASWHQITYIQNEAGGREFA
jgi:hypothetical protein